MADIILNQRCSNCNKAFSRMDKGILVTKEQKGGNSQTTRVCQECLPLMKNRNWRIQNGT